TERLQQNVEKLVTEGQVIADDESLLSEEDIEEELGYISPLDSVDPYLAFKSALSTLQAKNPSGYQVSTTSLNMDQQVFLTEVMRMAEQKEAEVAAAGAGQV
ncbi:hypothetical protein FRC17_011313, partial [Serendipita sp. 399]